MRGRLVILVAALVWLAAVAAAFAAPAAIKTPAEYLGFDIGADRKLADYEQARAYFDLLDEASPWVTVKRIGTTTLGKPMIAVILSTPANLEKLDHYTELSRRLADPRKLTSAEADALIKEARIITMITPSLHATEVGAMQMTLELAYDVAAG